MVEKGRRPGNPETRREIVEAARQAFVADGYDRTSLRRVAARAGVDPALIYHYFPGGKASLFAESMHLGTDPRRTVEEIGDRSEGVDAGGGNDVHADADADADVDADADGGGAGAGGGDAGEAMGHGAAVVLGFLRLWDADPPSSSALMAAADAVPAVGTPSFVSLVQAVSASPSAADALREFLIDRVWSHTGDRDPGDRDPGDQDPGDQEIRRALFTSQLNGMAFTRYVLRLEPMASASPEQIAAWIGPTLDRYASGPLGD